VFCVELTLRLLLDCIVALQAIHSAPVQNLVETDPQHAVGLLHIALNIRLPNNCASVLLNCLLGNPPSTAPQLLQHVDQPDVLHQLLQTAVLRQPVQAITLLCRMPAMHQASVEDVSGLIALVLAIPNSDVRSAAQMEKLLSVLCHLQHSNCQWLVLWTSSSRHSTAALTSSIASAFCHDCCQSCACSYQL
jgi:hypothetical protein